MGLQRLAHVVGTGQKLQMVFVSSTSLNTFYIKGHYINSFLKFKTDTCQLIKSDLIDKVIIFWKRIFSIVPFRRLK
jgi:hypothetical protein